MSVRSKCCIRILLLVACALSFSGGEALAQFAGPAVAFPSGAANAPASAIKTEFGDIRIMPGDIISISTYGAPELTTSAQTSSGSIVAPGASAIAGIRVGPKGEIVLPYLGAVKVAGLTPSDAAAYLENELKDGGFLADPQIGVQLVDSPSRVITVVGEVQKPAPVLAFGQIRLLDAIAACGGFTTLASHTITIRRPDAAPVTVELGVDPKTTNANDIQLMAGDTVIVPRVGNVFVVGEVKTEAALPLSSNAPITVMRAIAMAGGLKYSAALSKARIIRTTAGNRRVEIMLDLKKLMNGKQQDVALVSDDILFIPANAFKASVAAGGASVAATLLNGATYTYAAIR
jgi:polysaccharide export outer membrane protein